MGGTIAQISDGLYLAQQRYFESFFFLLFGFLPFPGAQLVMWVLFINLTCVGLVRFTFQWERAGIIFIHTGLMLFLVSAFVTFHSTTESQLTLTEGQASKVSIAYHQWELALWPQETSSASGREIISLDVQDFRKNQSVLIPELQMTLNIKSYFRNCQVKKTKDGKKEFESLQLSAEAEQNTPCVSAVIQAPGNKEIPLDLSGDYDEPEVIQSGDKKIKALLRLKRYPLPFVLKLKKFKKEEHPGTATPRSFESLVEVIENNVGREKLIAMNEPLRFADYTLYQASFADGSQGRQTSTLAVVKNSGRLMPYVSTFVTFFGLALHFGMSALRSKKKRHA
jgi:hypothetical protein